MATTVLSGPSRIPVQVRAWAEWRSARRWRAGPGSVRAAEGDFCAICWGQGKLFMEAANGEGLIPVTCSHCGGGGRVHRAAGPDRTG